MKRRDFLSSTAKILGVASLASMGAGCGSSSGNGVTPPPGPGPGPDPTPDPPSKQPNFLLMIVDELRLPPVGYGPNEGEIPQLKELLGFGSELSASNGLKEHYRAFARLRENSVVCRANYIASAACVPSRTSFITGAYPPVHGCAQTDGMFKGLTEVPWLDPDGIPTLGDWMRAGGYTTHWFGKWHNSNTETGYDGCDDPANPHFEPWGFEGGEVSCPEPHGGGVTGPAGGLYRDAQFADSAIDFLRAKGTARAEGQEERPWLAVSSLVNPHDIGYFPNFWYLPGGAGAQDPKVPPLAPAPIPSQGEFSNPGFRGVVTDLNPDGLPQRLFNNPSSLNEDLSTKPDCHLDYSYKVSYAINSAIPLPIQRALARPYQTKDNSEQLYRAHGEFYCYLTYLVNLEMARILDALDESGLREDTIVVFISDHGNLAGAHGGMTQKWHTSYEETIRVPMVFSSPLLNPDRDRLNEVRVPTSLVDLVPTVLGLAGLETEELAARLGDHRPVELAGEDLSELLRGTARTLEDRPGVLYATDDRITELPDPELAEDPPTAQAQFQTYLASVAQARTDGVPIHPGPVVSPNCVRCLITGEWKLARTFDPDGVHPDQWEMYHLLTDPTEVENLLQFRTGNLRPGAQVLGLSPERLAEQRRILMRQLAEEEARLLTPQPLNARREVSL